jgi:hypothetical protein
MERQEWVPAKQVCKKLGLEFPRHRERLLKSDIKYRLRKAPGNNGRRFKMLCIRAEDVPVFESLVLSAKKYKKKDKR